MEAYGHSMIVDPWGRVVSKATTEPGLVLATIDLAYLEDVRRRLPALEHRKLSLGNNNVVRLGRST